jgi:hypothetical protein
MKRYGLRTKREAVNFALRELAVQLSARDARKLRGSGWDADLDELRATRAIRNQARILHADADFDTLAEHTNLEVARLRHL